MTFPSVNLLKIMSTYNVCDAGLSYRNIELKNAAYSINELQSNGEEQLDKQVKKRLLVLLWRYFQDVIVGNTEIIRSSGI